MTSEGLGEMFQGAGKFLLVSMGAERRVSRAHTWERGPPSALAEIFHLFCLIVKLMATSSMFLLFIGPGGHS